MRKSTIWKKIIMWMLIVAISVPMMPMRVNAASNDYTTWKQTDPAWNQKQAWPKSQYSTASMRTMREAGCVVTSIAMLLRQHNVVTEQDVNKFNPWIFNEQLKAYGCFDNAANLYWGRVSRVYPSFKYVGSKPYSLANIRSLYNSGYACVIKANSYHYVALRSVNGSTVNIMDPGYNRTTLASYSKPVLIQYYSVPDNKPGNAGQSGSYATISGYNIPGNMTEGKTYSVRGSVSSTSKISAVTAGVYTSASGGTMKTGKTVYPNTTSYNLAKIDQYIYFNRLSAGTYYYRVSATNSLGTKTLINSSFSITPKATYASISNYNIPGTLKTGQYYSVKGTISSGSKITSVTAGVYTSASGGTMKTGKTVYPNNTSYNLKNVDAYLYFNRLPAGTYYYRVIASNSAGSIVLINRSFNVTAAATYAKISGYNTPSSLKVGRAYSVRGTVSSDSKISALTVGVYTSASGGTMKTGRTVRPNTTSYSISKIDPYVYFNRLPAGTYYYRITATNAAGEKTLVNTRFYVRN